MLKAKLVKNIFRRISYITLLCSLSTTVFTTKAMAERTCHSPTPQEIEQIKANMKHVQMVMGDDGEMEPSEEGYREMGIESGGSHCSKNPGASECKLDAGGDAG